MSDLYLSPTTDGGQIVIELGKPQMTGGLDNAVYLSLFTPDWWGNAESDVNEKYNSRISEIMNSQLLTVQTKLNVIEEAKKALNWMVSDGLVSEILITAEIPEPNSLYMAIRLIKPEMADNLDFKYELNWSAQEVSIL